MSHSLIYVTASNAEEAKHIGVPERIFAAQWLACTRPCQRFAPALAGRPA